MTSGSWTRRRRQAFPSTRPPDHNGWYRHRARQRLWLVGPPAPAASAGHDAWSAAPWTRGFIYPCAEAPLPPERGRHGRGRRARPRRADRGSQGNFGLRADYGISPQLTGSADQAPRIGPCHRGDQVLGAAGRTTPRRGRSWQSGPCRPCSCGGMHRYCPKGTWSAAAPERYFMGLAGEPRALSART